MTCPSRRFPDVAQRIAAWAILGASTACAQIATRYGAPPRPVANLQGQGAGRLEGFVYWDSRAVKHNPAGACNGFSVTVIAGGHALVAGSGQFGAKYIGQVNGVYDVCTWAYDHVQENTSLSVQLAITQPSAFTGNVVATNSLVGPVTVISAQCNMLPDIATATAADLGSHPGSCQNMAFDLNFHLVAGNGNSGIATLMPRTGLVLQSAPGAGSAGSGPLLTGGAQPMLMGNGNGPSPNPTPSQPAMSMGAAKLSPPPAPTPSKGNTVNQYEAVTVQRGVTQQPGFTQWANGSGTGGTNAGIADGTKNADGLNPQPYPPKAMNAAPAAGVSGNMPAVQSNLVVNGGKTGNMPAVQSNLVVNGGKAANLALPANLRLFSGAEAKNPAAANLVRTTTQLTQNGGAMLGPEQTMSAPGNVTNTVNATNPGPAAIPIRAAPGGPGAMQPSKLNSMGLAAANNGRMVCMNTSITAVNGGKFTQFTPGTHYTITGCGFGSAPGKVYLSGSFPAHNGEVDLGPYWQYPERRTWTGHWSDQVIDAQLDPGLLGELDQDNIALVVQTSTGQQIQMTGVSFKAQRAEMMVGSIPSSALGFDPHNTFGAWGTPCFNWIKTAPCAVEVLRQIGGHGMANPPDTYTFNLKPGFVLSRVKVLIMGGSDGETLVQTYTPTISGNQIVMHWRWNTTSSIDSSGNTEYYSYSLYGLQIYVIGPQGVTNAWAGP